MYNRLTAIRRLLFSTLGYCCSLKSARVLLSEKVITLKGGKRDTFEKTSRFLTHR